MVLNIVLPALVVLLLVAFAVGMVIRNLRAKPELEGPAPDGFAWLYYSNLRFARCLECQALVQKDGAPGHRVWHERQHALNTTGAR